MIDKSVLKGTIISQSILGLLFFSLLFFSTYTSSGTVCSLLLLISATIGVVLFRKWWVHIVIISIPFTFIFTVFLYNTKLFENGFKAISFFKIGGLGFIPLIVLWLAKKKKFRLSKIDLTIGLYIILLVAYFPLGGFPKSAAVSNLQQMISFLIYFYIGRYVYQNVDTYVDTFLKTTIFVIIASVIIQYSSGQLSNMFLSPREYSIESIGLSPKQFVGDLNASCYSFLFYQNTGMIKRFFGIFFSGIGMAYFLAMGMIITYYKKNYVLCSVLFLLILWTLTRAVPILLILSFLITSFISIKKLRNRVLLILSLVVIVICVIAQFLPVIQKLIQGQIAIHSFDVEDQSAAMHLMSIFNIVSIAIKTPFGGGLGRDSGESFLVDVFARIGIVGLIAFLLIFINVFSRLVYDIKKNDSFRSKTAFALLAFCLIGSLFSRETFTILDSFMSWIYIGCVYQSIKVSNANMELERRCCNVHGDPASG
jgi:hypothetical protein